MQIEMNRPFHCKHVVALTFCAILSMFVACTTPRAPDAISDTNASWDVQKQAQHAAALVAVRYASILHDLREGRTDKVLESVDWWLDQTIITLADLEQQYPDRDWANMTVSGDGELKMRRVYQSIAQTRLDHPRRHSVPLHSEEMNLIEDFVERYK